MHEGDQRSAIRLHGSPHLSPHLSPFSYRIYSLPRRAHPFILSKYVHLLVVIEVYSKWCGPVATVGSAYKALRAKDDEEAILTFHTVVAEDVHRTWEPENPKGYEHLDAVFARHGKSEPMFLIYRNGMLLETLEVRDVCGGSDHPHNPQRVIQIHQDGGFSPISPLPRTRLSFPFFFVTPLIVCSAKTLPCWCGRWRRIGPRDRMATIWPTMACCSASRSEKHRRRRPRRVGDVAVVVLNADVK